MNLPPAKQLLKVNINFKLLHNFFIDFGANFCVNFLITKISIKKANIDFIFFRNARSRIVDCKCRSIKTNSDNRTHSSLLSSTPHAHFNFHLFASMNEFFPLFAQLSKNFIHYSLMISIFWKVVQAALMCILAIVFDVTNVEQHRRTVITNNILLLVTICSVSVNIVISTFDIVDIK
jgi:hypothetical protein